MPRRSVSNPIGPAELDAAERAMVVLALPGHRIADAEQHVAPKPGLYAVHAAAGIWKELGLGSREPGVPLYIGKAEDSLVSRDLRTHFATGRTGSSTVRRSFAALLRRHLDLAGIPRNPSNPERFANFGLSPEDDARLTAWMYQQVTFSVWVKDPAELLLADVEAAIIRSWTPPVNIDENPSPHPLVVSGREAMKLQARQWAIEHGFDI